MKGTCITEKATLRKEIRAYIQDQIVSGRFQAGDRIVETQLAKELHVSQAPVREAILELAAMGILEERPYSGSFVRSLTLEDIEDIYNTRAFLDEYAARQAARKITPEQLAKLRELLQEMDEAGNPRDFVEKDMAFHAMVVEAAGSPSLSRVWESLRLAEWTGLSAAVTRNTLPELAEQHWQIYRLLETHADHTAGAYMFLHIKNFGDELKLYFAQRDGSILPLPGRGPETAD
ncbi:MAG: GntR family transcriptional regulator [Oscillibacter sp.]|nr:GntR family transcriptional regulator [Oscillibacter sp.]